MQSDKAGDATIQELLLLLSLPMELVVMLANASVVMHVFAEHVGHGKLTRH